MVIPSSNPLIAVHKAIRKMPFLFRSDLQAGVDMGAPFKTRLKEQVTSCSVLFSPDREADVSVEEFPEAVGRGERERTAVFADYLFIIMSFCPEIVQRYYFFRFHGIPPDGQALYLSSLASV